ncbi:CBS domain-containing protein [Arenibacter palladensis]|uniref:CBS domain-containing protein n=1 Tax=Arenibacter palladensis TaxID=237373 RepID=A0A1M5CMP2_9FLAO|nr:CBS domain-containing protein [Arenibacter palladensis]MDO6603699.1 CBS domain-containing protein [Arenibacter palladensis]SHF56024.1 CBS domain-containing protein [Arenibacter palladensis]|tara:strand:+ start:180 stop:599 length:420 start_codon:yes stop_codon:yes gene_type:complete
MKKREPVSKIMTTDLVTINHTNSLLDAEKLFEKHKIRHIPVVSNKKIIGILSLTDLLRISFVDTYGEDDSQVDTAVYNMLSIEQVMVKDPVHIAPSLTIKEVAEILAKKEFHALPVVENGDLVGIVTTTDLLNYLLEQY